MRPREPRQLLLLLKSGKVRTWTQSVWLPSLSSQASCVQSLHCPPLGSGLIYTQHLTNRQVSLTIHPALWGCSNALPKTWSHTISTWTQIATDTPWYGSGWCQPIGWILGSKGLGCLNSSLIHSFNKSWQVPIMWQDWGRNNELNNKTYILLGWDKL